MLLRACATTFCSKTTKTVARAQQFFVNLRKKAVKEEKRKPNIFLKVRNALVQTAKNPDSIHYGICFKGIFNSPSIKYEIDTMPTLDQTNLFLNNRFFFHYQSIPMRNGQTLDTRWRAFFLFLAIVSEQKNAKKKAKMQH